MKRTLQALAFLLVVACGKPAAVGAPCSVNADCDTGYSCNTTAPGGMCTHGCSFDGATISECPAGSVCTNLGGGTQACAPICNEATTCRDQYQCNGVSGSNIKACKPKP